MAKTPKPAETPEIDPDAMYKVRMARAVKRGPVSLSPRNEIRLKGALLIELIAEGAVASHEAV